MSSQVYTRDVLVKHGDIDRDSIVQLDVEAGADVDFRLNAEDQINAEDDTDQEIVGDCKADCSL